MTSQVTVTSGTVHLIVVTGNIGSGKTTTLRQIETWVEEKGLNDQITIIFENVEKWGFYLKKFYQTYRDQTAKTQNMYGFLLQMQILHHYHEVTRQLEELHDQAAASGKDHYVFVERSPFDAKEVFVDTNKSIYTKRQYNLLAGFVDEYTRLWMWNDATYIQIVTPAVECHRRITKRDRGGENKITLAYLVQLEEAYAQLAFRISMKTLSVSANETPQYVAHSIWKLAGINEQIFSE